MVLILKNEIQTAASTFPYFFLNHAVINLTTSTLCLCFACSVFYIRTDTVRNGQPGFAHALHGSSPVG